MHETIPAGDYTCITIHDNGSGMNEETLKHLFEPFYTTKDQGTGLGLANVYGTIKQFKGFLKVESEPGEGSTFSLFFPRLPD